MESIESNLLPSKYCLRESNTLKRRKLVYEYKKNSMAVTILNKKIFSLQEQIFYYNSRMLKSEIHMFEKKTEIQRLATTSNSITEHKLDGWLLCKKNFPKNPWSYLYIVACSKNLMFYDPLIENCTVPILVLDLTKVFQVQALSRKIKHKLSPNQTLRSFEILYGNEGESRPSYVKNCNFHGINNMLSVIDDDIGIVLWNGHDFISTTFYMPTDCRVCPKPLWSMNKPLDAFECRNCSIKVHAEHLHKDGDKTIAVCKLRQNQSYVCELLFMAKSIEDKKLWIKELWNKVENSEDCIETQTICTEKDDVVPKLQSSLVRDVKEPLYTSQLVHDSSRAFNRFSNVSEYPLLSNSIDDNPDVKFCCSIS